MMRVCLKAFKGISLKAFFSFTEYLSIFGLKTHCILEPVRSMKSEVATKTSILDICIHGIGAENDKGRGKLFFTVNIFTKVVMQDRCYSL